MNSPIKEIVVQTYRISLLRVIRRGHHITELKTMISKIIFTQIFKADT
jgi:hypothetical protein